MNARKATILCAVIAAASAAATTPSWLSSRAQKQKRECLAHLIQLNEPLNCCVPLEKRMNPGDPIAPVSVADFFKAGILPACPSGIGYTIPYVAGGRPVCPKHGDLLATVPDVKVYGPKPIYLSNTPASKPN